MISSGACAPRSASACSTSSEVGSAQCRSSKASTIGWVRAPASTQADERRELAAAQFLGRKFRNAARRQRRVDHRREQRRIFGGVEPDRAERRLEFGEALFAGDFGAAEAGAAPFRDRDAAACSATAARTPTRPRCAASPRAGRETPRSAAICRGPARRRSARAAPRRGARAPSGASRMSSSSPRPTSGVGAREPPRRPPPLARTMR